MTVKISKKFKDLKDNIKENSKEAAFRAFEKAYVNYLEQHGMSHGDAVDFVETRF